MITSDRHLLIPLYQAERCWAYAMELRDETRGDRENFPRKHFHQLRKLASAVKYAGLLQSLCVSTDSKTCLEAEAYHAFFAANSFLAREQWELALENFVRSRTIYDNMLKMGLDPDEMDLFHEKVEEIDPNIRLCQFRINGSAIDASRIIEKSLTSANPTFTLLQSKLEAVIIENRKKQAENIEKIIWRRTAIPLKSEKIKLAVINVQDILTEIDVQQDQEEKLNSYAKLFNSYGDAAEILKAELRESQKIDKKSKKEETAEQNLKLLQLYFQNQKINKTIERNLMLAKSIDSELQSKGLYKKKRLEEIIRIYNNILQNFEDLSAIRDEQDFEDGKQIAAKLLTFKSFRCFYLALSYSTNSPAEASALLNRCISIIDNARSHHHDCASPSSSDLLLLDELEKRAKGELSSLRVMQFLKTQETKSSDSLSDSTAPEVKNEATLSDAPDFFDRRYVADNRIAHFPPEFLPVACKPTLYDLALSNLQFPDLTSRQPKRFWEWWKK